MGDKYVFDANIFINLHQRQPRDVYPSVWNKIDELMASGTIISSREVYDELTRSDDSLSLTDESIWSKAQPRGISRSLPRRKTGLASNTKKSYIKSKSHCLIFYQSIVGLLRAERNKTTQILL